MTDRLSLTLAQALALAQQEAERALWLSDPNPRVGCVITDAHGQLLGQGHTQCAGGAHAEIMALRDARAHGHSTEGATACVTLEPCLHQGRTGPCCDALIAAGIRNVVVANIDPNPLVGGQGLARLRAAGVDVKLLPADDVLALRSRALNIGFFSRMVRKMPWLRLKIAASLDGQSALENGASQWITSDAARADGHAWRARASAVLTGIGTVLQDRPRLDVRLVDSPRQPHLVLLDSRLQTPLDAPLFDADRPVLIYAAVPDGARNAALQARGATVIYLPGPARQVDLAAMLQDLAQREINELHVEAGHRLGGALLRQGLVDELLVYLAPKLLGRGQGMFDTGTPTELSQALPLNFVASEMIGPDLRIIARPPGRERF